LKLFSVPFLALLPFPFLSLPPRLPYTLSCLFSGLFVDVGPC
jgi:hypothetical protein